MSSGNAGSYAFDELSEKEIELNRLLKQASILPELELSILRKHGLKDNMKVLDAACGPGAITCLISNHLMDCQVTGMDINDNLLQSAMNNAELLSVNAEFIKGDIYDLPFDNEFDFIYCRFLFQHLHDPAKALQSIHKSLKPGGILCITDVDDDWLTLYPSVPAFNELTEAARKYQKDIGGDRTVGRKLQHYLKKNAFKEIEVEVQGIHSDLIGIHEFIKITTGFKMEALKKSDAARGTQLMEEIMSEVEHNEIFGIVGVFFASGTK